MGLSTSGSASVLATMACAFAPPKPKELISSKNGERLQASCPRARYGSARDQAGLPMWGKRTKGGATCRHSGNDTNATIGLSSRGGPESALGDSQEQA